MKKIILFGGTFDPVHNGHLVLAQYALEFIDAKKVIFIPSYIPPHKLNYKITHWRHRLNMLKLAIKGNPNFEISEFEIKNKGVSYTYKTVDWFSKQYKDYKIYFLIGFDSLLELHTWQNWRDIIEKVEFLVGTRMIKKEKLKNLNKEVIKKITYFDSPIVEISSTEIRSRVKKGLVVKYFLPEKVEKYIYKNKLYI